MAPNEAIDILDSLLEKDITKHQEIDIKEILEYIKNNQK